jgi:hypothetical protein
MASASTSLGIDNIVVGVARYADSKTVGIQIIKIRISVFQKKFKKKFEKKYFFIYRRQSPRHRVLNFLKFEFFTPFFFFFSFFLLVYLSPGRGRVENKEVMTEAQPQAPRRDLDLQILLACVLGLGLVQGRGGSQEVCQVAKWSKSW